MIFTTVVAMATGDATDMRNIGRAYLVEGPQGDYRGRVVWRFPNGWGASVIPGTYASDEVDLAVWRKHDDGTWHLNYTSGVTGDTARILTRAELIELLTRVKAL